MSETNKPSARSAFDPQSCAWCEYFDGGGLAAVQRAREGGRVVHGDCLNPSSRRFGTTSDDSCAFFVSDEPGATARRAPDGDHDFLDHELLLDYLSWEKLLDERIPRLDPEARAWLGEWRMFDLGNSPMDDGQRRQLRRGHHLGWMAATDRREVEG